MAKEMYFSFHMGLQVKSAKPLTEAQVMRWVKKHLDKKAIAELLQDGDTAEMRFGDVVGTEAKK